jgi:transcriptional regulator of acetoin/glycerol metabolism
LQETIGARQFNPVSGAPIDDQIQNKQQAAPQSKAHWDFLVKEMKWMAEDFERETKKKVGDAKKNARACKK